MFQSVHDDAGMDSALFAFFSTAQSKTQSSKGDAHDNQWNEKPSLYPQLCT